MTDLLTRPRHSSSLPGRDAAGGTPPSRPLWLTAGVAGPLAALGVLVGCMAVALVGWFSSEAGAFGDTRDALRVGADAWLLGHGATLSLPDATITAIPLGLTWLAGYVAYRLGRWAAATSQVDDAATVALGTVVLAGGYAVVAVVTAVLASLPVAQPSIGRAVVGGALVGGLGGGLGLLLASPVRAEVTGRLPEPVRAVARGALGVALLLTSAGAVLTATALLLDLGAAATVLSRLHADGWDAALSTVLVAAAAPNAALLGAAYLAGPGFAVGTGTLVSPTAVVLGPVPAFPLLAALPGEGQTPAWATALVAVPVLLAVLAGLLTSRRHPAPGYGTATVRGLGAGLLGGLLTAVLMLLAGGSVGPGRMSEIGAPALEVLAITPVACGLGAVLGTLLATGWQRRGVRAPDDDDGGVPDPEPGPGPAADPDTEATVEIRR